MRRDWPLGPEVKRAEIPGGAFLFDSSRVAPTADWFEPRWWRERGAVEAEGGGRGNALFLRTDARRLVLRHYHRGGLIGRFVSDRYWWTTEGESRPFAEWAFTYHLRRAGLPVPIPIAARYVRHGRFYRGDLITERVDGARSLESCLFQSALSIEAWVAIGRCLRRFHNLGVCHADLNVRNILLTESVEVYLIDLDRGSLRRPGMWRDTNLVRLRRSIEEVADKTTQDRFTEHDWQSLLDGYRGGTPSNR